MTATLPLANGSLRFLTLPANLPSELESHVALLRRQPLLWAGPELYAGELHGDGVPGFGRTFFPGTRLGASFYCGLQAVGVSGSEARPLLLGGREAGVVYEDAHARYALLGGLIPRDVAAPRIDQTQDVFLQMEEALGSVGMDFSHVVRTWLYNDRLLEWYGEFNRARDAFFASRGVFDGLVPASTGIGSGNGAGAALQARAFAVQPKDGLVTVRELPSPLQCSARDYRSSFSRAVELDTPHFRQVIVSGTASIAPGGETLHVGDAPRQIELALDVIEAILQSRGMGWGDVVRSVAYVKHALDSDLFRVVARRRGLEDLPCILVQADVCRDDLLFEMELDAAVLKAE